MRTTSTEHSAWRLTASETLPIKNRFKPVRPCEPTTMRSACNSRARSMMRVLAVPTSTMAEVLKTRRLQFLGYAFDQGQTLCLAILLDFEDLRSEVRKHVGGDIRVDRLDDVQHFDKASLGTELRYQSAHRRLREYLDSSTARRIFHIRFILSSETRRPPRTCRNCNICRAAAAAAAAVLFPMAALFPGEGGNDEGMRAERARGDRGTQIRFEYTDVPMPEPAEEVLVRVRCCGVCRTDLHVIEGELTPRKSPVIPGHQVVGVIEKQGRNAQRFPTGARVGVAWLHHTDGTCSYCRAGAENLCDHPTFTGYSVDGGYAEYVVASQDFVYAIPVIFLTTNRRLLCCARELSAFVRCAFRASSAAGKLAFYGFGAAAHVAIQVARHWEVEVYASTRDVRHQRLARDLGAVWAGGMLAEPPEKALMPRLFLRRRERLCPRRLRHCAKAARWFWAAST